MAVTSAPTWSAAHSGIIGDASATAASAQINQLLGTHADTILYQGNPVLTPDGTGGIPWALQLSTQDIDQPFTMSGTSIGRVTVPILPVGAGADLVVSLCADNAGQPGSALARTRIPASWINSVAAVNAPTVPSAQAPIVQYSGSALALAQFNPLTMGAYHQTNWPYPASGTGGPASNPTSAYYDTGTGGGYFLQMGGNTGSTHLTDVYSVPFDSAGNVSAAIPQPAMPSTCDGTAAAVVSIDPNSGACTLVHTGGSLTSGSVTADVFTASFDPTTGSIASWSTQTSLPYGVQYHAMAAANGYVYVIGGANLSAGSANQVVYGQVQNGQITSWTQTAPLPLALGFASATIVNGLLYVLGGYDGVTLSSVYYAPVNSDGSLGAWRTGPSLPVANSTFNGQTAVSLATYGLLISAASNDFCMLSATTSGPDIAWQTGNLTFGGAFFAAAAAGDGQWQYYGLYGTNYTTMQVSLTPRISVPLPATGLTNGATYHILLQQNGGSQANYLRTSTDSSVFPGNPTLLSSAPNAASWAPAGSGTAVPLQIYDQTVSGQPWHVWEDTGARIGTLAYATTLDQRLLGVLDAVVMSAALNGNTGFEQGLSPWTASGGTVAQSTTWVYEGTHSMAMTPNGTSMQCYAQSEQMACWPGQQVQVSGWFYAAQAIPANFSLSVNWYTAAGSYLSTSGNTASLAALTPTQLTNQFTAPTGAYRFSINPVQGGTPASSSVVYGDQIIATDPYTGAQLSTAGEITYPGAWPGGGVTPPTGLTVLA